MEPQCPGCRERDLQIAELERRVAELTAQFALALERIRELEARLGQNSSNSSLPPSSNPPQAPPPVRKEPTGRKPGGQSGHRAFLRVRLPSERITEPIVDYLPDICKCCQDDLSAAP